MPEREPGLGDECRVWGLLALPWASFAPHGPLNKGQSWRLGLLTMERYLFMPGGWANPGRRTVHRAKCQWPANISFIALSDLGQFI